VDFFKAPETAPSEIAMPEPKAWQGPPLRVVPGLLADRVLLAHTDRVAIAVGSLAAYPTGFTFAVETFPRRFEPGDWAGLDAFGPAHAGRSAGGGQLPPELFRFGVEFADGRRATSLDVFAFPEEDPDGPPHQPVLRPRGGGGGGGRWTQESWVWPLPPAGPLAFVCEWPALDIPLTRGEIDGDLLRDAASRALTLWDDAGERPAST
jgi:hypothetical protein